MADSQLLFCLLCACGSFMLLVVVSALALSGRLSQLEEQP
jgi:hypothetical protein